MPKTETTAGHETWGWDGATGYRCRCGQMLAEESWRDGEPLWRIHLSVVTGFPALPAAAATEGDTK